MELDKYKHFFNWAKRYFWLTNEKNIGNIERAIIRDYHLQFDKIKDEVPLSEFNQVCDKLNEIRLEVLHKKKNDLRKDIKIENVLDFLKD